MVQLFRDCCKDALEKGQVAVVVALSLQLLRDLFVSVVRERGRELIKPSELNHPLIGVIDAVLIPTMVAAKLLALGPIITLMIFSIVIGALAVVASLVMTKLRPTVRLWVKLSA
jgi:hypothetical protein